MPKLIKQFMWPYQHVLRGTVAVHADLLFKEIGWEVESQAFLVGVRVPDRTGPNPVCLEPEDGKWPFAPFAGLDRAVATAVPKHEMQNMFYGDAAAMREKPENIYCTVVSEQVRQIMAQLDSLDATTSFVSQARRVDDYYVAAVLQVPMADLSVLPDLPPTTTKTPWVCAATNLARACILQVLRQTWDQLGTREPGHTSINHSLHAPELARRAASDLLTRVTMSVAGKWESPDLFRALNDISTVMYEREESRGRLLLVDPASKDVRYTLKLADPVPLRDARWSRKLVQLALADASLICDGASIFGLGSWAGLDSAFEVEFLAQRSWILRRGAQEFIRSHFGDPKVPKDPISEQRFHENYRMQFPNASPGASQVVWQALRSLETFDHGSLIVVSEDAATEAVRLRDQGTVIEPTMLGPKLLESASRIDGTILADPEGRCHAIGVIVDGSANQLGSPSRGGRYNAALRYALSSGASRLAIVVSDDRTLDVIPLRPKRISRGLVEQMIRRLEAATLDNYHEPRNFLESHRFYLSDEHCERVNKALARIHSEPREWNALVITSDPFAPHPAMAPIYWLEE